MEDNNLAIEFNKMLEPVRELAASISQLVLESMKPMFDNLNKTIHDFLTRIDSFYSIEYIEKYKNVSMELKKFGWTISFKNPNIDELDSLITNYRLKKICREQYIKEVDSIMLEYVNDYDKQMIFDIFDILPERSIILRDAYKLYEKEFYNVCIPIFLIQSDGFTRDILHLNSMMSIYAKKEYERNIKQEIYKKFDKDFENIEDLTTRMIYANIAVFDSYSKSLSASSFEIDKLYDNEEIHSKFSRHTILHGIDNSYGSKLNAAKCLSIFSYLSDAFPILVMLYDADEGTSKELN